MIPNVQEQDFDMRRLISQYSDNKIENFNERIFTRTEDDITEQIQKVILSAQRSRFFTIKVESFKEIKSYREVYNILYKMEEARKNKRIKFNIYDYINCKRTAIYLLQVNYLLGVGTEFKRITVYIALPRIVDKYYFLINGNHYFATYQIVDSSTYNNASSKKNVDRCVTLKTSNGRTSVYEKFYSVPMVTKFEPNKTGEIVPVTEPKICVSYYVDLFGKLFSGIKYIFAKFGVFGGLSFLNIRTLYILNQIQVMSAPISDNMYVFTNNGVYVTVAKYEFDNNPVCQSVVSCILDNVLVDREELVSIFSADYWKRRISNEYKNNRSGSSFNGNIQGESILDSFEHVLDIRTRDILMLDGPFKRNMYDILRWIMYEFEANMSKLNTDISIKRVRFGDMIAAIYALHLGNNINNISNLGTTITLKKLIQAVSINCNYLIDQLKSSNMVPYNNLVNDNDFFNATKFSFKGVSGLGEKKTNNVSDSFRLVSPSHLGRLDRDTSSAGDPGMTGIICPYAELDENMYFDRFQEPNNWYKMLNDMHVEHNKAINTINVFKRIQEETGVDQSINIAMAQDSLQSVDNILSESYNKVATAFGPGIFAEDPEKGECMRIA